MTTIEYSDPNLIRSLYGGSKINLNSLLFGTPTTKSKKRTVTRSDSESDSDDEEGVVIERKREEVSRAVEELNIPDQVSDGRGYGDVNVYQIRGVSMRPTVIRSEGLYEL